MQQTVPDAYSKLHERVGAASAYFTKSLDELLDSLRQHKKEMQVKQKVKKYIKELYHLELDLTRQKTAVQHASNIAEGLMRGTAIDELLLLTVMPKEKDTTGNEEAKPVKPQKGDTHRMSLELFKQGKKIAEIAAARSLTTGTIEGHLARFIPTGEILITDILSEEKIAIVTEAIKKIDGNNTTAIRTALNNAYSHGEIRAVMVYLDYVKK